MSEKPTRVEVGQRWQFETAVRDVSPDEIRRFESNGRWVDAEGYSWRPEDLLASAKWTFLGYAPSPETGPPVMGERRDRRGKAIPAACLGCGGELDGVERVFVCVACYPKPNPESDKLAREFLTGRRDFPRPPMETPPPRGPIKAHGQNKCVHGNTHHCAPCDINRAKAKAAIERLGATPATPKVEPAPKRRADGVENLAPVAVRLGFSEDYDRNGNPVTALQRIQAKPKPEPYVCPVDDWDLLPDAGR